MTCFAVVWTTSAYGMTNIQFSFFLKRAQFNKSCNLIGSGSERNFPIRPALSGRNRHLLKNVSSLTGNLLNDLCYCVSKNLWVKLLSSTWIITVLNTICSIEIVQFVVNLAMITALKCSGLSHAFRCVLEKNKNVNNLYLCSYL